MKFKYGGREVDFLGGELRIIFNDTDMTLRLTHDMRLSYFICDGDMWTPKALIDYAANPANRGKCINDMMECAQMAGLIPSDHLALPIFDLTQLPSLLERTI